MRGKFVFDYPDLLVLFQVKIIHNSRMLLVVHYFTPLCFKGHSILVSLENQILIQSILFHKKKIEEKRLIGNFMFLLLLPDKRIVCLEHMIQHGTVPLKRIVASSTDN